MWKLPRWLVDPAQDEQLSHIDDEIREAGEVRYPLGFTVLIYLVILVIVSFTAWKVLWS